jgi:phosphonate utilization transcriptional regulator
MAGKMGAIGILKSKSLPAAVKDEISNMIISGEIVAGQKLTEMELALKLGVSRGPVREALLGLEEAGLVLLAKNRGVFVRDVTASEASELYDLRSTLEEMAGRILAPRITQKQVEALRLMVDEMASFMQRDDMSAYFPQNIRFHDVIVEFAGNSKLLFAYRRLINEMHLMRRHELVKSEGMAKSVAEHGAIVDALASRSPDQAAKIIASHVQGGKQRLLAILDRDVVESARVI